MKPISFFSVEFILLCDDVALTLQVIQSILTYLRVHKKSYIKLILAKQVHTQKGCKSKVRVFTFHKDCT